MRGRTDPNLPGRCPRCYLVGDFCVCARLPIVPAKTRILVVRHVLEARKSTNSARIAALVLPNLRIEPYGAKGSPFDASLLGEGAVLLFPALASQGDASLSVESMSSRSDLTLVVPDGNWSQARRMAKRLATLPASQPLPRFELPSDAQQPFGWRRLRQRPRPDHRSTFEAIAAALAALEGPEIGEILWKAGDLWVSELLRARGLRG